MSAEVPRPDKFHVYLLIGGVNMAGRAPLTDADDAPLERCFLLNGDDEWEPASGAFNRYSTIRDESAGHGLGPARGFVKAMLAEDETISIGLVVNAGAGKENFIEHWRYKDHCYRESRRRLKAARRAGTLKGVLWHQDNNRIDSSLSFLKDLIGSIRVDQGMLDLPFVVGGVAGNAEQTYASKYGALVDDIHATGFASANGLILDGRGFDAASAATLGARYAQEMIRLQREQVAQPAPPSAPVMPVIDSHVHAEANKENGLDVVAAWMERNGVERCISKPLTPTRAKDPAEREIMLANYRKYQGRIYRFCLIEPGEVDSVEAAVAILEKEKAEGAIGFGEHYGRERMFDDPENLLLYAACEKVGLPVHFHIDGNKNMDELGLPRLERVLKMYPDCKLIAHAQFWLQLNNGTCDRLLQAYPNLYAEPSGVRMAAVLNRDRTYTREFLIRNADKILFATDAGWWSFGKGIEDREIQFELFEHFDLPLPVKSKIYRENAERLFGFGKMDGETVVADERADSINGTGE